jgi:hypothetical protein
MSLQRISLYEPITNIVILHHDSKRTKLSEMVQRVMGFYQMLTKNHRVFIRMRLEEYRQNDNRPGHLREDEGQLRGRNQYRITMISAESITSMRAAAINRRVHRPENFGGLGEDFLSSGSVPTHYQLEMGGSLLYVILLLTYQILIIEYASHDS